MIKKLKNYITYTKQSVLKNDIKYNFFPIVVGNKNILNLRV